MSRFNPIELDWQGVTYSIPGHRVMGAIAIIEETITLVELYQALGRNRPPLSRIASAFANILTYAGAKVTAEEVYDAMFSSGAPSQEVITKSLVTLLAMMQPPSALRAKGGAPSGNSQPTGAKSSKRRSKRRSAMTSG